MLRTWAEEAPRLCTLESIGGSYEGREIWLDRKSTRLNSSHSQISYAVFCLKKKIVNSSTNSGTPLVFSSSCAWTSTVRAFPTVTLSIIRSLWVGVRRPRAIWVTCERTAHGD